jgi:hypothetical protein
MVGAEHHEKGTRSAGQVAAVSCAVAPEPSAGSVASNVASCAGVHSCKPATAASASVSAAASSKASSACPRMSQHHHRIHRLRAAVLHQGIFSRRERQSAGGAAPHQHEICQLRGGDPFRPVLRRPTTNFTRPRTRSSNPVPSSRESTNVRSLSDSWSGQRIVGLTRKRSFVPGMLTTAQANSSSSAFASFWFESSPLQRRVRCEPIFPPVQKAAPKTRGGAHEPLTQIKQFLSAAHHLLSK